MRVALVLVVFAMAMVAFSMAANHAEKSKEKESGGDDGEGEGDDDDDDGEGEGEGGPSDPGCGVCFGSCQTEDDVIQFCHRRGQQNPWNLREQDCDEFDSSGHDLGNTGPHFDVCPTSDGDVCVCPSVTPPPPPPSPTECGPFGVNGTWTCAAIPVEGGNLIITRAEATSVDVTVLTPGGCMDLTCEVEVCGEALHRNRQGRSLLVGFEIPGPCGIASELDTCGNREAPTEGCPPYYTVPVDGDTDNGWEVQANTGDVLVTCRTFTLAHIIGVCPGVDLTNLDIDSTVEFDVFSQTRIPCANCTEPACNGTDECCDSITHTSTRHVIIEIGGEGSVDSVTFNEVTTLDMRSGYLTGSVDNSTDCICTQFYTAVSKNASLGDPTLFVSPPQPGTIYSIESLGACGPEFPETTGQWDPETEICQVWEVCTDPSLQGPDYCPPIMCDGCRTVQVEFCVIAEGIPQNLPAIVDLNYCPHVGGEEELPEVNIDVEPPVCLVAWTDKDRTHPYVGPAVVYHGTCMSFQACIVGYPANWPGIILDIDYDWIEIVIPDDSPNATDDVFTVYPDPPPAGAPLPYEDRDVIIQDAPDGCVRWTQTANVADGSTWFVRLHYIITGSEPGGRRMLSVGYVDVEPQEEKEEEEEEEGEDLTPEPSWLKRTLQGWGSCGLGIFCSPVPGHASIRVNCDCKPGFEGHYDRCPAPDGFGGSGPECDKRGRCPGGRRATSSCHKIGAHYLQEWGYFGAGLLFICFVGGALWLCTNHGTLHAWGTEKYMNMHTHEHHHYKSVRANKC